jgi:ABC-2 type transport system permease protein
MSGGTTSGTTEPAARLYDVRYSRYSGTHEPRWRSVLALARSSTGRALGLRRTAGAKVWPFFLLACAYLPVIAVVGIPLLFDEAPDPLDILSYEQLLGLLTLVVVAFSATTLPSLLTRERRDRVLSLYFSTALSRTEYVAGKVLAAVTLTSLVTLGPLLALFAGTILTAEAPLELLRSEGADLPAVVGGGLVVAIYFAALGLLAGSLTAKRVFAVGGLLAALLVTPVLSALAFGLSNRRDLLVIDLSQVPQRAASAFLPGQDFETSPPDAALVWAVWALVLLTTALVVTVVYRNRDSA